MVDFKSQDGHVFRGGILVFGGQSMGVYEMRTLHAEIAGVAVHFVGKFFNAPRIADGQTGGHVVATFYQQGANQASVGVMLSGLDTDAGGLHLEDFLGHRD